MSILSSSQHGKMIYNVVRYCAKVALLIISLVPIMSKLKKKKLMRSRKTGPKFTPRQRLEIGLACLYSCDPGIVDILCAQHNCSRSHVFNCRQTAIEFMNGISDEMIINGCFSLNQSLIDAVMIVLTLACRAPLEGIQLFFQMIFNLHISIGRISETISRYSQRAQEIVKDDDYSNVRVIASDEIYMGHDAPILITIDPETTAVLMMKPEDKLSAELWTSNLSELSKRNGLKPEVAVNDSGSALMKGIPLAFEDIEIQPDIFHTEIDLGYELTKFMNYSESLINEEYKLMQSLSGKKIHQKTVRKLQAVQEELEEILPVADGVMKAYEDIKQDFGFTGCRYTDAVSNASAKLDRMLGMIPSLNEAAAAECMKNPQFKAMSDAEKAKKLDDTKAILSASRKWKRYNSLRAAIHRLDKRIRKEGIFGFLKRLESKLEKIASEHDVPSELIFNTYSLYCERNSEQSVLKYDKLFAQYWDLQKEDCLDQILSDIQHLVAHTIRASSLVENTNHKVRPYIQMKKILTPAFCCLLQLFLNTKIYRRSIKGRAGKSPMELLTGKQSPPFLELIGIA